MADRLLRFLVRDAPVRGEIVRLDNAWQQIVALHDYPAPVERVLGEMTAAALLLASNIKFDGALILQIHGDGPVRLLVVECQSDLSVRATAKLRAAEHIARDAPLSALVNAHGRGRCAILLDPKERAPGQPPYQGIVPLAGESVADALETYMRDSEQLDTRLWLAADHVAAAGLLLQKLPVPGGGAAQGAGDADAWDRTTALVSTVTRRELLAADPAELTTRVFWQEQLDHYAPRTPRFRCTCSRERIGRMLISLGRAEAQSILTERGSIEVTCEFCHARQAFDAVDVEMLFATGAATETERGTGH